MHAPSSARRQDRLRGVQGHALLRRAGPRHGPRCPDPRRTTAGVGRRTARRREPVGPSGFPCPTHKAGPARLKAGPAGLIGPAVPRPKRSGWPGRICRARKRGAERGICWEREEAEGRPPTVALSAASSRLAAASPTICSGMHQRHMINIFCFEFRALCPNLFMPGIPSPSHSVLRHQTSL